MAYYSQKLFVNNMLTLTASVCHINTYYALQCLDCKQSMMAYVAKMSCN